METTAAVLTRNFTKEITHPDAAQLSNLLHDLAAKPGVCIRFKVDSLPWPAFFSQVLVFNSDAILLAHMPTRTVTYLRDLECVTAFELDGNRDIFSAFVPYTLKIKSPQLNHQVNGPLHA